MPLTLEAVPLDSTPESVRRARLWVRDVLTRLHRDDIVAAAQLGVSELVTNAILHGEPPISVRVRGTRAHPRVEIRDGSIRPPAVNVHLAEDENLLSTFGRGLGLMALYSVAWGAEVTPQGKVVWFEPSNDPRPDGDLTGEVFDLNQKVRERVESSGFPSDPLRVRIVGLPVALYNRFRQRYYELARELRLLALAHGDDYPVASDLSEVFMEAEQAHRTTRGWEAFNALLSSGAERGDVELLVPRTAPETLRRLLDSLERADDFCREQRLLTLAATPEEAALQRWFFTEFSRQAEGEEPLPWPGPFGLDDAAAASP